MKPEEKKPKHVYRIIDEDTGKHCGSYSRSCGDKYDFTSAESARNANCHDMFQNRAKYSIAKYEVTYTLIEENVQS